MECSRSSDFSFSWKEISQYAPEYWTFKNFMDVAGLWVFVGLISHLWYTHLSRAPEYLPLPAHQTYYDAVSV